MAKFTYTAIDAAGKPKNGTIEAASKEEATQKLTGLGLMVSAVSATSVGTTSAKGTKAKRSAKKGSSFSIGAPINQEGLTIFTRQLATLLQAGLPLLRALEVMIRQEKRPAFKAILEQVADNVRSGNSFSDGLAQHPKVFKPLFVNTIVAGEKGGVLDVVLERLAKFMEKDLKTRKKIKSAMIYPSVIITVALLIVAFLLIFIVPKFQEIFSNMLDGARMPALTQFVIDASNWLKPSSVVDALVKIGIIIVVIVLFRVLLATKKGSYAKDWLALKMPKVGDLVQKAAVARFARTLGTLLSSGVSILDAIKTTRDIINNAVLAEGLDKVHDRVRDGEPLARPLEQTNVFPTMVTSMIEVGEETGELSQMLDRVADNYEEDLDNAVSSITSLIEPIMIVFLAIMVGTIVIALFLPIIGIIQNIQ